MKTYINGLKKKNVVNRIKSLDLLVLLVGLVFSCATSGSLEKKSSNDYSPALTKNEKICSGRLDNGLEYYLLPNANPENRIFIRFVVKVGSILEDENEKGLANFVNQLAFNATKNFDKNDIAEYFELIGMSYGPETNSYTSFDETVYKLEIPANNSKILKTTLQIIKDWAMDIDFDSDEVEKKRAIIIEEWREGDDSYSRLLDALYPVLFKGSRYANRLPIGDKKIVKKVTANEIKSFYKKWYRPELMAVVFSGDFNSSDVEKEIIDCLSSIPSSKKPSPRKWYEGAKQNGNKVLIFNDTDLYFSTIEVFYQIPANELKTEVSFKEMLIKNINFHIFNSRIEENIIEGRSRLLAANIFQKQIIKPTMFNYFSAIPNPDFFDECFFEVLEEMDKIKIHGITSTEFELGKENLLHSIKQSLLDKDNQWSSELADEIVGEYLYGNTAISLEERYNLYNKIIPQICLEDCNKNAKTLFDNRGDLLLITLNTKDKNIASEKELLNLWKNWESKIEVKD